MINYNSPIIIYALLLDKKIVKWYKIERAVFFSKYTPQAATISDNIVRRERLYEKCTAEKRRFKGNCEFSGTIVNRLFQTYAGCFYRNLKNVNYILR